jgi:ABC-type branched-subunit amino acid transport system substrate-binding protein
MKNIWPTWNAVIRGLALALALMGVASCASVDPVVKIGLVGPFEGRHRAIGYDAIYSARLAVREINAAGGVGGYRVALVALDDRGDPELAAQAAASLALDPAVVAVVGHYLPETTAAALPVYERAGVPLIATGAPPFAQSDPERLPADFLEAYAGVTPFDETAGPFAGSTYDAFGLLWQALAKAEESAGAITRSSVQEALPGIEYKGMMGEILIP